MVLSNVLLRLNLLRYFWLFKNGVDVDLKVLLLATCFVDLYTCAGYILETE